MRIKWLVIAGALAILAMWVIPDGHEHLALACGITGLALLIAEVIRTQ